MLMYLALMLSKSSPSLSVSMLSPSICVKLCTHLLCCSSQSCYSIPFVNVVFPLPFFMVVPVCLAEGLIDVDNGTMQVWVNDLLVDLCAG